MTATSGLPFIIMALKLDVLEDERNLPSVELIVVIMRFLLH